MRSKRSCRDNSSSWLPFLALLFLTITAFALRFTGFDHGVGHHPDERGTILQTLNLSWENLQPEGSHYGALTFYLLFFPAELFAWLTGKAVSYDSLFGVARFISITVGTAAVVLVYSLGRHLALSPLFAFTAALLLAFNPLHLQLSHFYTPDILLTTTVVLFFVVLARPGSRLAPLRNIALGFLAALALGFKVNGAFLLLPWFITAAATAWEQRSLRGILSAGLIFSLAFIIATALVQPFLFIDPMSYWEGLSEQLRMVRGEWKPPYTLQFENTTPYLYHLKQGWFYTLTPPVVILAAFGALLAFFVKSSRLVFTALALWVLALFLLTGGHFVKFPRYLLPIYPALALFASLALKQILAPLIERSRFTVGLLAFLLLAWPALAGLSLLKVYSNLHTYEIASHWIKANIPDRARLAFSHWDDTLPLHLPGMEKKSFRIGGKAFTLELFEPESDEKLRQISGILERADYVVFPTQRAYHPILNNPDRYPETARLVSLLMQEELGYELVRTFRIVPKAGPFTFPNFEANESLVTYDHPKVMVFKNRFRFPASRIQSLTERDAQLLSPQAALHLERRGPQSELVLLPSSLLSLFTFYAALQLASLTALPYVMRLFSRLPDYGYGASKLFGLLLLAFPPWLLGSWGGLRISQNALLLTAAVFALGALFLRKIPLPPHRASLFRKLALRNEIFFTLVFFLCALIRSFHPEIFWGEKTMDLSFLNYFYRLDALPPIDPWASGQQLSYYYCGYFIFAKFLSLIAVSPTVSYNLVMILLPAASVSIGYSLFTALLSSRFFAALGALALPLVSNFELIYLYFFGGRPSPSEPIKDWTLHFDLFWRSSRVYTPHSINEYPFWAFLFNDLHAHVMVFPLTLLFLLCCANLPPFFSRLRSGIPESILAGFTLGLLFVVKSWDFVSYSLLLAFLFIFRILSSIGTTKLLRSFGGVVLQGSIISASALLLFWPMFFELGGGRPFQIGWNHTFEFNTVFMVLRMHAVFLLPLLSAGVLFLFISKNRLAPLNQLLALPLLLLLAALPFLPLLFSLHAAEAHPIPTFLIASALLLIAGAAALGMMRRKQLLALASVAGAAALTAFIEYGFLFDRMNTVFKFTNGVWTLLGIGAVWFSAQVVRWTRWSLRAPSSYISTVLLLIPGSLLLLSGAAGSILNTYIYTKHAHVEGPRPTLQGTAFLRQKDFAEASLYQWLNENITGTPTLVEAHLPGKSYNEYTAATKYTGIPGYLGWDHHVRQRGTPHSEANRRALRLDQIFRSRNPETAARILKDEKIQLVVIGDVERERYPLSSLQKFEANEELFLPLYKYGQKSVYAPKSALIGAQEEIYPAFRWRGSNNP